VSPFSFPWRRRASAHHRRSLESLVREGFVAIDLETTGLDPARDAIVELAAIPFLEGRPTPGYVTHVNPERPIPPESSRIHGIGAETLARAPRIGDALTRFEAVCADHVLVGHGIAFDLAVLRRERRARGRAALANPALDTLRLAAALRPNWARLAFEEIASHLGIGILGRHTAEADALAAGEILVTLIPEIRTLGVHTIGDLLWLQDAGRPGR
jgi:DNA polymerase III epsilon subunit family exonuclease